MLRRCLKSLVAIALPILLPLGGCEEHADDAAAIQAVQSTAVRDVSGNGERDSVRQRMTVAEYVQEPFRGSNPRITWVTDELPPEGGAERVGVTTTIRLNDRFFPSEIAIRFGYDPATRMVVFRHGEIEDEPAQSPSGGTLKLSGVFKAMALKMLDRQEAMLDALGGDGAPDPSIEDIRRKLRQPD
jgi:hypothetical protein